MEMKKKQIRELAVRIYELDRDVYEASGSSLGRVFNGNRKRHIRIIKENLLHRNRAHVILSDMALISNMARTLRDDKVREEMMLRYEQILSDVQTLPTSFTEGDILDLELSELNSLKLDRRFGDEDRRIICIGRTFGACGNEIGFELANKLGMNFYDNCVVNEMLGIPGKSLEDGLFKTKHYKNPLRIVKKYLKDFKNYHGLSERDKVFFDTTKLLIEKAEQEDMVIMGRFAHNILTRYHIPHVSLFITAPLEARAHRLSQIEENMTVDQARKLIEHEDAKHRKAYLFYTGKDWAASDNYDLTINAASYGMKGTLELILKLLEDNDLSAEH